MSAKLYRVGTHGERPLYLYDGSLGTLPSLRPRLPIPDAVYEVCLHDSAWTDDALAAVVAALVAPGARGMACALMFHGERAWLAEAIASEQAPWVLTLSHAGEPLTDAVFDALRLVPQRRCAGQRHADVPVAIVFASVGTRGQAMVVEATVSDMLRRFARISPRALEGTLEGIR
jgi:hypothetical protein